MKSLAPGFQWLRSRALCRIFGLAGASLLVLSACSIAGIATEARKDRACRDLLARVDRAKASWAAEHGARRGDPVSAIDLVAPDRSDLLATFPGSCPHGGVVDVNVVGEPPCHRLNVLCGVREAGSWTDWIPWYD